LGKTEPPIYVYVSVTFELERPRT